MRWAVCQYGTGDLVILPCDYVMTMMMSGNPFHNNILIVRTFRDKNVALDYLTELVLADNIIYKALK